MIRKLSKSFIEFLENVLGECNLNYLNFLLHLIEPFIQIFILSFFLPICLYLLFWLSSVFLFFVSHWRRIFNLNDSLLLNGVRIVCAIWHCHARIWHSYEIKGIDKLPNDRGCLLILYHGALPADLYYLVAYCILMHRRRLHIVGDKFLFKIPGIRTLLETFEVCVGSLDDCQKILEKKEMLIIAPGGVREALFGDNQYELIWGQRIGYAKVAFHSKCSIFPVFTENIREAYRAFHISRYVAKYLYEKTRLPLSLIYGMFPVKLTTHIGEEIEMSDEFQSPKDLGDFVREKMKELILSKQQIPGNILRSILQRII
ncbi:hypothetical protein SNEBB_007209 [Seison nebaliae]|nr:hypothetical protein SNEBB_007209 [Seison nebaliae]